MTILRKSIVSAVSPHYTLMKIPTYTQTTGLDLYPEDERFAVYTQWFLIMAFLHPLAWIILKLGRVSQISSTQR